MKYSKIILNRSTPKDVIIGIIEQQSTDGQHNPGELLKLSQDENYPKGVKDWAKAQRDKDRQKLPDSAKKLLVSVEWGEIKNPTILGICPYVHVHEQIKWSMNLLIEHLNSLREDTQSYQNFIKTSKSKTQDQILYSILRKRGMVDKKLESLESDVSTRTAVLTKLEKELKSLSELINAMEADNNQKATAEIFIRRRVIIQAIKKAEVKLLTATEALTSYKKLKENNRA